MRRLGYLKDSPDDRDYIYQPKPLTADVKVSLRSKMPAVYDQAQLGSCTGNSTAGNLEYLYGKEQLPLKTPSRLWLYLQGRKAIGTQFEDSGAQIRDVIKSVNSVGTPQENGSWLSTWSYSFYQVKYVIDPIWLYNEAKKHVDIKYYRLNQDLVSFKSCLQEGYPVVVGFLVYESFESPNANKTGIIPMPGPNEELLGGHSVLITGYNDETKHFEFRNSWGAWGDQGYGYLPYDYLMSPDLSEDFWSIQLTQ